MDNCWDYNEGKSHAWMGRALRDGYRKRVFLMTKIDGRTRKAAAAQIDQSLRALGDDVIDLMQIHEVIRASDADRVFGPDGAIEALLAAKKAGKIRFIGFTGHKSPAIHLEMMEAGGGAPASRSTPCRCRVNVMDAHYDSFERRVLPGRRRRADRRARHEAARLGPVPAQRAARRRRCRRWTACTTRWACRRRS